MAQCPVCEQYSGNSAAICDYCGFSFQDGRIVDPGKLQSYVRRLRKEGSWVRELSLKLRLKEVMKCNLADLARLLGDRSKGGLSAHIALARSLDAYPELRRCRNVMEAQQRLKQIRSGATLTGGTPTFSYENELQRYLCENWEKTPFAREWILARRGIIGDCRYPTGEVGEMDLLARGTAGRDWLVLELKRGQSSDETVGQLLRYMGWVKENRAEDTEVVYGLIIAATSDRDLRYALSCVPNVSLRVWQLTGSGLRFTTPEEAEVTTALSQLSPEERETFIREFLESERAREKDE